MLGRGRQRLRVDRGVTQRERVQERRERGRHDGVGDQAHQSDESPREQQHRQTNQQGE